MDVIEEARRRGWELEESYRDGRFVFRWVGGDERAGQIQFGSEAEALSWMRQRLEDQRRSYNDEPRPWAQRQGGDRLTRWARRRANAFTAAIPVNDEPRRFQRA